MLLWGGMDLVPCIGNRIGTLHALVTWALSAPNANRNGCLRGIKRQSVCINNVTGKGRVTTNHNGINRLRHPIPSGTGTHSTRNKNIFAVIGQANKLRYYPFWRQIGFVNHPTGASTAVTR